MSNKDPGSTVLIQTLEKYAPTCNDVSERLWTQKKIGKINEQKPWELTEFEKNTEIDQTIVGTDIIFFQLKQKDEYDSGRGFICCNITGNKSALDYIKEAEEFVKRNFKAGEVYRVRDNVYLWYGAWSGND